jgi:hypothetical protein
VHSTTRLIFSLYIHTATMAAHYNELALLNAIIDNRDSTVAEMLTALSVADRVRGVNLVCRRGRLELVQMVFSREDFAEIAAEPSPTLDVPTPAFATMASVNRDIRVLRFVLQHPAFTPSRYDVSHSIFMAIDGGRFDSVRLYLDDGRFDPVGIMNYGVYRLYTAALDTEMASTEVRAEALELARRLLQDDRVLGLLTDQNLRLWAPEQVRDQMIADRNAALAARREASAVIYRQLRQHSGAPNSVSTLIADFAGLPRPVRDEEACLCESCRKQRAP